MASTENFTEIYKIIKDLYQTLDQIEEDIMETVAIKDTKGNLLSIITFMFDDLGHIQLSILEDTSEFINFISYFDMMISYPNQLMEALMMKKGIEIKFGDREELPKKNYQAIKDSGVSFRGRGKWPFLIEFNPLVLVESISKEKKQFLETILGMFSTQENREVLLQAFLAAARERKEDQSTSIPLLIWNPKKKTVSTSKYHLSLKSETVPSSLEPFFPKSIAPLLIPEFTVYRLEKQISSRSPHVYEISLRFSEHIYRHSDGEDYLGYELLIADPEEGLVYLKQFDEAKPQQLQEALLDFLAYYEECPTAFVTSGVFGLRLLTQIEALANRLGIDLIFEEELEIIDSLTEIDILEFIMRSYEDEGFE
ncbi:DUF7309 domain-containing protein [Granulicatella seriolae]|uniref:DUF7309 domain-containing protein n=1 Tax=Granulicatella seriolae TaxID=2967226 RepID=A0ABT1WPS2_9LACT|nr:hypothetical protein [Granulicatella seriolae]